MSEVMLTECFVTGLHGIQETWHGSGVNTDQWALFADHAGGLETAHSTATNELISFRQASTGIPPGAPPTQRPAGPAAERIVKHQLGAVILFVFVLPADFWKEATVKAGRWSRASS